MGTSVQIMAARANAIPYTLAEASNLPVGTVASVDVGDGVIRDLTVLPHGWLHDPFSGGDYPPQSPQPKTVYVTDQFSGAIVPQGEEFTLGTDGLWHNSKGEVRYPVGTKHTIIDVNPVTGLSENVDRLEWPGMPAPAPAPLIAPTGPTITQQTSTPSANFLPPVTTIPVIAQPQSTVIMPGAHVNMDDSPGPQILPVNATVATAPKNWLPIIAGAVVLLLVVMFIHKHKKR